MEARGRYHMFVSVCVRVCVCVCAFASACVRACVRPNGLQFILRETSAFMTPKQMENTVYCYSSSISIIYLPGGLTASPPFVTLVARLMVSGIETFATALIL